MSIKSPLNIFMDIKPGERLMSLLMALYFFLVITGFWILKPIKKALFVGFYREQGLNLGFWTLNAAQAEQLAKALNVVVAFGAMVAFTALAKHFRREKLTYIFALLMIFGGTVFMLLIHHPNAWIVWGFYLFGDLFTTLMVATFFAFLNDSVDPEAAKRLYGLIGLGGVLGGVFGSSFVRIWASKIDQPLLFIGTTMILLEIIMVLAYFVGRLVPSPLRIEKKTNPSPKSKVIYEGALTVLRSPYMRAMVIMVGLYEIMSTLMDFQFVNIVLKELEGPDVGTQFATAYAIMNWVSLFVQFFLTSLIMTRLGVLVALLILPIAMASGSALFMLFPVLWVGTLMPTLDGALNYSINQSAKETLYVPLSPSEKYKAKAFIDMFVQRFAKTMAVGITLLLSGFWADFETIRWISIITIGLAMVWIMAVKRAGTDFELMAQKNFESKDEAFFAPVTPQLESKKQ